MEQETQRPQAGLLGCDQALFAQVWERVSGASGRAGPIELLPPAAPAPPPAAGDRMGSDRPDPGDVPCLGRGGQDHQPFLQRCIREELEAWRSYQFLSARAAPAAARTLAAMAADERRHAQRLSGAYFLLSGLRFLPPTPPVHQRAGSFWGAVREGFWEEQTACARYAAAAEETADACLAALYRDLAGEEAAHADLLRAMVEKMPEPRA